jgi:cytochrome c1
MVLQRLLRLALAPVVAVLLVTACGQDGRAAGPAASAAIPSPAASATPSAGPSPTVGAPLAAATVPPTPAPMVAPTFTSVPASSPTETTVPTTPPTRRSSTPAVTATTSVDLAAVARGKAVFASAGCGLCHTIQGVSTGNQCPDLTHIATQPIPSPPWDKLSNDPTFLHQWIKNPQAIKPGNLMPDLGLTDEQVSDVVAFLETQR